MLVTSKNVPMKNVRHKKMYIANENWWLAGFYGLEIGHF